MDLMNKFLAILPILALPTLAVAAVPDLHLKIERYTPSWERRETCVTVWNEDAVSNEIVAAVNLYIPLTNTKKKISVFVPAHGQTMTECVSFTDSELAIGLFQYNTVYAGFDCEESLTCSKDKYLYNVSSPVQKAYNKVWECDRAVKRVRMEIELYRLQKTQREGLYQYLHEEIVSESRCDTETKLMLIRELDQYR